MLSPTFTVTRTNYSLEVAQLGRCIESGEKPFITEEFTVKNAELLDRVLESMKY